MLRQKELDGHVIATNESHGVEEFAERALDIVGLDSREYVQVDKRFLSPSNVNYIQRDYLKAWGA
jgi:GDPmannose 4,6-dehydratase